MSSEHRPARSWIATAVGLTAVLLLRLIPLPEGIRVLETVELTRHGQAAIGVLLFALVLWITEAIPFHLTGMLAIVLLALLRVDGFVRILELGFGSHISVFMIGVLILSSFVSVTGLGTRITTFLLQLTGSRAKTVIFGFLSVGALLSMWLSNLAVAAMLTPLATMLLREQGLKPLRSNFGKALMIACAWGPAIGGVATPAGAGPNPLAIGFLRELAGIDLPFHLWMAYGVPTAAALLFPAWVVLILMFPPEIDRIKNVPDQRAKPRTSMSRDERVTVSIFLLTVVLWLFAPVLERLLAVEIPVSMTVAFTAALLFLPGLTTISWKEIERQIHWGSIVLVLAGISVGMSLHTSGAAEWMSTLLLGGIADLGPFGAIFATVGVVSLLKIVLSSNTVTAAIVVPLMISVAAMSSIGAMNLALPAALTSSLGLVLVTSAPASVIPYSSGYFSIADMARAGVVMTLCAIPIVAAVVFGMGQLVGT